MRSSFAVACLAPFLLLALVAAVALHEWWIVGVVSDPAILSQYPFGSEGPAGGFAYYASPQAYARHHLLAAVAGVILAAMFAAAWHRTSRVIAGWGYIATAAYMFWFMLRFL